MESNKRNLEESENEENVQKKAKTNDIPHRGAFKQLKKHSQLFKPPTKKGILLCCMPNREDRAIQEAISLLTNFADELYGAFVSPSTEDNESSETKRFAIYNTGSKGLVFIGISDKSIHPTTFVDEIMQSPRLAEFAKKIQFIYKLVPMEVVTKAELPDIMEAAKGLISTHIESNNDNNTKSNSTFGIVFSKRNNEPLQRDAVIKEIGGLAAARNSTLKVDLNNPNYCIIVEVFKSACGICIVHNYDKQKRSFNLQLQLQALKGNKEGKKSSKEAKEPSKATTESTKQEE